MNDQFPALIVVIPLSIALLSPLLAFFSTRLLKGMAIAAFIASHLCAIATLIRVLNDGPWSYWFGGWEPPWGIEYAVDPLNAAIAVFVTFIGILVSIYSGPFFKADVSWLRLGIIYALNLLIIAGLSGMILTGDAFNLYVFLEITALATYALVAAGGRKASVASYYYVLVGTVGASLYLLGVGYMYAVTGSLNMADLSEKLQPLAHSPAVLTAIVMLAIGMAMKMALFPMHGWLPDVYTYAPPPVTVFISSVMSKVYAYVLLRLFFFILDFNYGPIPAILNVLGVAAAAGILAASVMAIGQKDFRRLLAYSSVSQIGYIVMGIAIGTRLAHIGAVLHIINHAFMKCCLFMVAGGVKWKTGEHTVDMYSGLDKKMPLSMGALLIAAISMIGLPPTAGFFSKWYLAQGAIAAGQWPYVIVIAISSLLNAVYFFMVIEQIFLKKRDGSAPEIADEGKSRWELPAPLLIPIILVGVGILALGLCNEWIVSNILHFAIPVGLTGGV